MKNFFTHKIRTKSPLEIFVIIVFGIIFITGLAILLGYVIMSLWNWLMPELFGLPELRYWQAVGLFVLIKLLFGSCGGSKKCDSSKCDDTKSKKDSKTDFSKWKHYEQFWKEEGEQQYKEFVEKQTDTEE